MAAKEWWEDAPVADAAPSESGNWWDAAPVANEEPRPYRDPVESPGPRSRSPFAVANDTVIEAANAVAGGVGSVANFVAPGNRVSRFIDENIIKPGEKSQSDIVKAEKQQFSSDIAAADGLIDEAKIAAKYAATNPLLSAAQAAGSFALPGGAVKAGGAAAKALGVGGKVAQRAALGGGAAAGAALSGGDAAGTAYDLAKKGGATEEQAVEAARQASVIPAVIGGAGGLVGAERLVAGAKGFTGNVASRALKTGAVEAAQEGLEEGVTQYEGQRAAVPYNPGLDPMKGVGASATTGAILGAATGGTLSALTPGTEVSFTPPTSLSAQAGLTPIVVPTERISGGINARNEDRSPELAGRGGVQPSVEPIPGVADLRPVPTVGDGRGGNADAVRPDDGEAVPVRGDAGQQSTAVGDLPTAPDGQRPLSRASDASLLDRVMAQQPTEQAQPVTIWTGRAGDGYADVDAAQAGLETRVKREPDLRWEIERMPSGKYRLAGYEQGNSSASLTSSAPQPTQTIQPEIKQDSFDTAVQPVQNPSDVEQVSNQAAQRQESNFVQDAQGDAARQAAPDQTTETVPRQAATKPAELPGAGIGPMEAAGVGVQNQRQMPKRDVRLVPMSKRAEYTGAIAGGVAPMPAPTMTDKADGTLDVAGDPKALKQQLINAGIPPQSILNSKTGVVIGRSQVSKARDILSTPGVKSSVDDQLSRGDTADYAPATQVHRDAAAKFARAIGGRIEGRPANDLLDAVAPGGGDRGRAARTVSSVARRIFSREVVYVKFKGDQKFNGAVSKASPGYIFINIDSQKPLMAVLGHELLHELEKNQPGIYADLSRSLDALLKNETAYTNRLLENYKKQGISTKDLRAREELEADIVGDNFMDPEFWQAIAKEQPSLFRRIADAIIKWLDGVSKKIGAQRPFGTDQFLTDIAAARNAVASAMRQFSGAEAGAVTDEADADTTNLSISEDTIEVDGVQRQRTNSKGQPIHPTDEGIRNFWRWFGSSKVTDADGRPLVVYHGTRSEFSVFDYSRIGDQGRAEGAGFYFTNNKDVASGYGKPMEVYLSIEKPLAYDAKPFSKSVVEKIVKRIAEIEANNDGIEIGDGFLSNFGDVSYEGLMPVVKQAGKLIAAEQTALDQLSGIVGSGVNPAYVNQATREVTGYDGVVASGFSNSGDQENQIFVAFFQEQIKSATGNQGAFDPDNADIRFSINAPRGQRFKLPEAGATAIARIKLQDDALRMKRVIDAVKEQGGIVGEEQNFYDANTLMPGRVQAMMDDFRNDAVLPMLEKAAAADISPDDLALYAYARHAEERNAYIASINPRMPDGGSGMTNADARAILSEFEKSGKAAEYADLHADLMGIAAATRRTMLDEGLITQEQYDSMESQYESYIPLRGFENVEPETGAMRPGVGRGINVRGKETIRALGRRSRAGDLIENVIRDYQRAVVKSEKNNVAKVLLDFVLSNPDPDLWGVDVDKGKATLNKATGQVEYSNTIDKGEDTIGVKVGGQQVYIKIEDKALARALRHAWKDEVGDLERAAVTVSGWYNSLLRNVLTRYNPPFALVNTIRDAQSGAVAALDELGGKGAAKFASYYPKALAAATRGELRSKGGSLFGNPVIDKYFTEFKNSGAITGGFFMKDVGDIAQDLRNDLLMAGAAPKTLSERAKKAAMYSGVSKLLGALEFIGSVSENATRFALYMAARDSGRTPSQAALLAKNGTTNFNRKGEWGGTLNALYLFFNAAVQGNAQLFKTLKNPKVRAALSAVAGVGVAAAMFGAAGGGEDDDGQDYWDKIPDYEKERNLIIMLPPGNTLGKGVDRVGKYGRYIKIPVQYGLNFFPNIGYMMADVYRNQQDPTKGKTVAKATKHLMSVTFGSVNPFGGEVDVTDSVSLAMALAPTILDLPIMLGTERNSFGSPVAPSKFPGDTKPDSERMFPSDIDTIPANIAEALNNLGGGNEAKPGKVLGIETSVTPGTIENLIRSSTGGLGMFGVQVIDGAAAIFGYNDVRGKVTQPSNWPVFNKVYGEVGQNQNVRMAGERMREVRDAVKVIEDQIKSGISPEVSSDDKRMLSLADAQETFQKEMAQLRKDEVEVLRSKVLSDEKKRLALENIKTAQDRLSSSVSRIYQKQLGPN